MHKSRMFNTYQHRCGRWGWRELTARLLPSKRQELEKKRRITVKCLPDYSVRLVFLRKCPQRLRWLLGLPPFCPRVSVLGWDEQGVHGLLYLVALLWWLGLYLGAVRSSSVKRSSHKHERTYVLSLATMENCAQWWSMLVIPALGSREGGSLGPQSRLVGGLCVPFHICSIRLASCSPTQVHFTSL